METKRPNRDETGVEERRRGLGTVNILSSHALAYSCRLKMAVGRFKLGSAYIHVHSL